MSEYLEALSRLNAGERPPGDDRHYFKCQLPRYDTVSNYNRIMAEKNMTKVPKFAIEQRIKSSQAFRTEGNRKYYQLDPSFTFAQGTRKSIGLRSINAIDYLVGKRCDLLIEYDYKIDGKLDHDNAYYMFVPTANNTIEEIVADFNNRQSANEDGLVVGIEYFKPEQRMEIFVYEVISTGTIEFEDIYVTTTTNAQYRAASYFHLDESRSILQEGRGELVRRYNEVYNVSPVNDLYFKASFVNYRPDQHLGKAGQDYSLVNYLYSYSEQCPQIWIETVDINDNPVEIEIDNHIQDDGDIDKLGYEYTIELSLICDTMNNFLVED